MAVVKLLRAVRRNALYSSTLAARFASSSCGASRTLNFHKKMPVFHTYGEVRVGFDRCKMIFLWTGWHSFSTKGSSGYDKKEANFESEAIKLCWSFEFLAHHLFDKNTHRSTDETEEEVEDSDGWEDDDETKPEYGDGGAGGGVVLQNVPWGDRVLSVAREVLREFGDDMELYAFKTTPRGYIYVRLDKLSNVYGCPDIEELEKYNQDYKKKLDEMGESGDIPGDLAVEVSSPGAERLLKVPDDLNRFKDLPMRVSYVEDESKLVKEKVFLLEHFDTELGTCQWKLADVKANRNLTGRGRPLSRKLKDWRLKLPYAMIKKVSLYLES